MFDSYGPDFDNSSGDEEVVVRPHSVHSDFLSQSRECSSGESDSDSEFLVHPILRSLIKSKSAYTLRNNLLRLPISKTTFQMNLSKMLESTHEKYSANQEPPVANFYPDLDMKWPEPQSFNKVKKEKEPPPLRKMFSWWSSPPNVLLDERISLSSAEEDLDRADCWSAPECLDDDVSCESEEEEGRNSGIRGIFSDSYPLIDTPEQEPSLCSIHLPSSSGSAASPSPSRPPSPVLGRPPCITARMSGSHSMQLRPRPTSSVVFGPPSRETSPSDDEWPQHDPWPQQEVWPEEDVLHRSMRTGWSENASLMPRSFSAQLNSTHRNSLNRIIPSSRSSHSHLCNLPETDKDLEDSAHSQLDEMERQDLITRSVWVDRGSTVQLNSNSQSSPCHAQLNEKKQDRAYIDEIKTSPYFNRGEPFPFYTDKPQELTHFGSQSSLRMTCQHQEALRRSYTTDELKRGRRRLPRRPDAPPYDGDLRSSISLYGHFLGDGDSVTLCDTLSPPGDKDRVRFYQVATPERHSPPAKSRPLNLPAINQLSTGGMRSPSVMTRREINPYADLETPVSPPINVLPSPLSTGRRLPALPFQSAILSRLPAMSIPHPPPKPQDHTLCFMDGMGDSVMGRSIFEDSYYEEDGINGNQYRRSRKSFFSPDDSSGISSCTTSDSTNPTHRVQSAFTPRHSDEVLLDIGDAVHIERTCEDHWCYGTNLRTGLSGIFPSAVVCEIDLVEEICMGALPTNTAKILSAERDTFYLTMLASIEVGHHKGNDVLVQAMNKVLSMYKSHEEVIVPQTVLMEVSFRGIHVIDKRKKNFFQCPTFDFFYSLQNISFCGAHPKQLKYFGFITKHPLLPRFACHVFMSSQSTQPIVESIGRAFKRSYDEYMAFAHPTEDIYLE